jgi:hypothetical protein
MKIFPVDHFPYLPAEVATLIQQGVYALYEIEHQVGKYLLKTHGKDWLLDEQGKVVAHGQHYLYSYPVIVGPVQLQGKTEDTAELDWLQSGRIP